MTAVFVPFDGWQPGGGDFFTGWQVADNLYPFYSSRRPWRYFTPNLAGSSAVADPITSAYTHRWMVNPTSSSYAPDSATVFAGAKTALQTVNPFTGIFTNVSRAAPAYSLAVTAAAWRFATIGNDIWACNWFDQMQLRTNNAGLFANGVVSTFKPIPRHLAVVREHLLVGNLNQGGRFQDEIAWSDADDATNFDPPTATSLSLAGSKRLVSVPGQITGLLGGQYGLAFKGAGIFYLEYTGTSQVIRPDVLSPHVGTRYSSSIINSRYGVFFLGPDGFYQIAGLAAPQKISPPAIDQSVFDSDFMAQPAGTFSASTEDGQMIGFSHAMMPLVGWLYHPSWPNVGNSLALLYNPVTQAWLRVTALSANQGNAGFGNITAVVTVHSAATLYDTLVGFWYSSPTGRVAPIGNTGASSQIAAPSLQLRYRPANLEEAGQQAQSMVYGVLPVFSKVGGTASTALTESVTVEALLDPHLGVWKTETAASSARDTIAGFYPFQVAGRFFRITITCAAEDFANFEGVYIWQRLLT